MAWGLGPGRGLGPHLGLGSLAWALVKAQAKSPKANGHKLGSRAMAQYIKYPWVRVGKPVGRELPLNPRLATLNL